MFFTPPVMGAKKNLCLTVSAIAVLIAWTSLTKINTLMKIRTVLIWVQPARYEHFKAKYLPDLDVILPRVFL